MTVPQAARASGYEAFTTALAARDVDALVDSLAPDVVLHSAITDVPFIGPEVLADLYAALFDSFEELRVTEEFRNETAYVLFWEGTMDGRFVEGADRVRLDGDGKVREITIIGRPLYGLSAFITGLGNEFARRRHGARVAGLLRIATLPLPLLFSLFDPITRWLLRSRSR